MVKYNQESQAIRVENKKCFEFSSNFLVFLTQEFHEFYNCLEEERKKNQQQQQKTEIRMICDKLFHG